MRLTEIAKPPLVRHTEILSHTAIISYPKPDMTIDDKILRDLDCPLEEWVGRFCYSHGDTGQSASLGCDAIRTPNSLLGGLSPAYPIAECYVSDGRYVYQSGCLLFTGRAYIFEREGRYERIASLRKLKAIFAPIESENEALSYAMAATGYSALYRAGAIPATEYYVKELENTHVEVWGNGYIVRLYDYSPCGCGHHETIGIDVAVDHQGHIREVYRELVYRDAHYMCGD